MRRKIASVVLLLIVGIVVSSLLPAEYGEYVLGAVITAFMIMYLES